MVKWVANGTCLEATKVLEPVLYLRLRGGPLASAVKLKAVKVSRTMTSWVASYENGQDSGKTQKTFSSERLTA